MMTPSVFLFLIVVLRVGLVGRASVISRVPNIEMMENGMSCHLWTCVSTCVCPAFSRFTNPSATEANLVSLQKEILREVLAYTPGHPSFGGSLRSDRPRKPAGDSTTSRADDDTDEFTSEGLNAVKALANTGTAVVPTSAVPLPTRNGAT